jgi:hypothetical protein
MQLDIQGVTPAEAREFIVEGLQRRREKLTAQIEEVKSGKSTPKSAQTHAKPAKSAKLAKAGKPAKGGLSAKGRAAIKKAQKERWARIRAAKDTGAAAEHPAQDSDSGETGAEYSNSGEIKSPVNEPVSALA